MAERAAVLTTPLPRHRPMPLARLAEPRTRANPGDGRIDWTAPIDRTRQFFCETLTPLFYTRVYAELADEHRLRYNQLTGMLANELILTLETQLLSASLEAAARGGGEALAIAVKQFAEDEARHARTWRRLNRLSEPLWYGNRDRVLCDPPRPIRMLSSFVARHPRAFPVIFWLQLAQEERSIDLSRRCLRVPAHRMEARYAAVYREHLADEVRHVQIDCHLIDRFYASRPPLVRRATAMVFRAVLDRFFLRPSGSTRRVIHALVAEFPELQPRLPRLMAELRALPANDDYQRMMYSRDTTPITFEMFDRFKEFHCMSKVLRAYQPASERVRGFGGTKSPD